MDSLEGLCPTAMANIHWIGHRGALMEGLDVTSVTVQASGTHHWQLTEAEFLIGKTSGKGDGSEAQLVSSTSEGPGANKRHSLQNLVETRSQ